MSALLPLIGRTPADGVVFVDTLDMAPTLRLHSVALLGERNRWQGAGLYALPGMEPAVPRNVYRAEFCPDGIHLTRDGVAAAPPSIYSPQALADAGFWPVVGALQPFHPEFGLFLREWFGEARP